jgi:uncharacterized protein YidB (DUF937 family)
MKQTVAILIGALLIAIALVFHAYQHRYEVAADPVGVFIRLDTQTGQLSACALVESGTNTSTEAILKRIVQRLKAAGFSDKQVSDWVAAKFGQVACSAWDQ